MDSRWVRHDGQRPSFAPLGQCASDGKSCQPHMNRSWKKKGIRIRGAACSHHPAHSSPVVQSHRKPGHTLRRRHGRSGTRTCYIDHLDSTDRSVCCLPWGGVRGDIYHPCYTDLRTGRACIAPVDLCHGCLGTLDGCTFLDVH